MEDVSYIAHTCTMPGGWGKGTTVDEAVANLNSSMGRKFVRENGYKVFRCHPDTSVGEMGAWRYPRDGGYEPVEIMNKSKHK